MDLITNRTKMEVLLKNARGSYGYEDLNRVETAVAQLQELAKQMDLHLALVTKTDWSFPEVFSPNTWPTRQQMERYLGNVHALCNALSLQVCTPETMAHLTCEGANEIENALLSAYCRVQGVLQTYQYSGEIYAGEENVL